MKAPIVREQGLRSLAVEFTLLPNVLSLIRILLVPFVWVALTSSSPSKYVICLILIVVSLLTDAFDGYFARRLNQQSQLGLILDPVSDKVVSLNLMGALVAYSDFPLWVLIFITSRDVLILSANVVFMRRRQGIFRSDFFGRWAFIFLSLAIVGYSLRWIYLQIPMQILHGLLIIVILFMIASSIQYLANFRRAWRKPDQEGVTHIPNNLHPNGGSVRVLKKSLPTSRD